MATPVYDAFVQNVRDWTNRDAAALPDTIIRDAMSYAADNTYHQLKVPPLESTFNYSALVAADLSDINRQTQISLAVPADLISIIHLRTLGTNGEVWNEKTDVRTFHDMSATAYSSRHWTRQGNNFRITGDISSGDTFELFYYRRLPALNGVYAISQANIQAGVVTRVAIQPLNPDGTNDDDAVAIVAGNLLTTTADAALTLSQDNIDNDMITIVAVEGTGDDASFVYTLITALNQLNDADGVLATIGSFYKIPRVPTIGGFFLPEEIPHWLKDENRKILLFGALSYCGRFLQDQELIQFNNEQYQSEISAVNREEELRKASGGNVQMHYNGSLI